MKNKNKKCEAKLIARIKHNTKHVRYRDEYAQQGYLGILRINFMHSHAINNSEAFRWLKRSHEMKEIFINYFNQGKICLNL